MSKNADYSSPAPTSTILVLAKIGAMFILGVGSLVLGVLPMIVGRCRYKNRDKCRAISRSNSRISNKTTSVDAPNQGLLTSLLLCFGGGVLLFTTFLHLAPEVRQSVERHQSNGQLMSLGTLSMAELLFCTGFFLVYLVEETVHATLTSKPEPSKDLLYRTVSMRRCNKQASMSLSTTTISSLTASISNNDKTSSFWKIGKFKYAGEEEIQRGVEDTTGNTKTTAECSMVDEIDAKKNGKSLGAVFVRSPNSVESSRGPSEVPSRAFEETPRKCPTIKPMAVAVKRTKPADTSVRGLLAVVALSFHAIFEGLAVGLEPSIGSVIYLAAAIATHKLVIAFCVGMELYMTGTSTKTILSYLSIFSLVTPLGIGAGLAFGHLENDSENLGPGPTILQGMAAGTLLYVVFFEVLARERANDESGLLQLAAIVVGFMLMLCLQLATSHSHSHSHGPSHGGDEINTDEHLHDDVKDHNHSDHTNVSPINEAIGRITGSVVEAVSSAIASSTAMRSTFNTSNLSDEYSAPST